MRIRTMTAAVLTVAVGLTIGVGGTASAAGPEKSKPAARSGNQPIVKVRTAPAPTKPASAAASSAEPVTAATAVAAAALTVDTEGPVAAVDAYVKLLAAGQPYRAVDQFFDATAMAKEVYGPDFDGLSADERSYIVDLMRNMVKTVVTVVPMHQALAGADVARPEVVKEVTGGVLVRLTISSEETGRRSDSHFVLRPGASGWKIVDMPPFAETFAREYQEGKEFEITPTDFAEAVTHGMLGKKLAAREQEQRQTKRQKLEDSRRIVEDDYRAAMDELEKAKQAMKAKNSQEAQAGKK